MPYITWNTVIIPITLRDKYYVVFFIDVNTVKKIITLISGKLSFKSTPKWP